MPRGDPESPLRWTCKSTTKLAKELRNQGHQVCQRTVWSLLDQMDYSMQSSRKVREGCKHPDRDEQFLYISKPAQWAIELLASLRFKRYLRVTKSNKLRIDSRAVREAAKNDGKWVLETNDDTLRLEDAAEGYKGLNVRSIHGNHNHRMLFS